MRPAIEALLSGPPAQRLHAPAHAGLAYEVWRPLNPKGEDTTQRQGQAEEQQRWMEWVERAKLPADYPVAYQRWRDSFLTDGSRAVEATLSSRLLVGHGNHSPTEIGITLHHTWGVPVIPATALKGLVAAYVQANYGPEDLSRHPLDPEHPERERALWQGVHWDKDKRRILDGPGAAYRLLFGAPRAASDPNFVASDPAGLPVPVSLWIDQCLEGGLEAVAEPSGMAAWLVGERQGLVTFHDALVIPDPDRMAQPFLVHDVLTVHQREYYTRDGQSWPNDYDSPNPVSFLTVAPNLRFLIALSGPPKWTRLAMDLLKAALSEWGIGGKTTSGYGRFDPKSFKEVVSPEQGKLRRNTGLQEFLTWTDGLEAKLKGGEMSQKQLLEAFEASWLEQLKGQDEPVIEAVRRKLSGLVKSPKQKDYRDALLRRLSG